MYILGINSAYHESAACLLKDGKIVAAAEEERFSRVKHGKPATVNNPDQLPLQSIAYCLAKAGITLGDVERIGFSMDPEKRLGNKRFTDLVEEGDWGSASGEEAYYDRLQRIPGTLESMGFRGEFSWLGHHICHAASAYYLSPFDEAAVIAVDGIGETGSALYAVGRGRELTGLSEVVYPASLGFLWEKIAKFTSFSEYDACKVMGLAAYGNSETYREQFDRLVTLLREGQFAMDGDLLRFRVEDYSGLEALFGVKRRSPKEAVLQPYRDITAALQWATEQVLLHMVRHARAVSGSENLCLAGGVALNCMANGVIQRAGIFRNIYVQPASHDAGTALGAATVLWHMAMGREERDAMPHAYLGPSFSNEEIERTLTERGVVYERVENIERYVAERLATGKVVGWFQGAMEFGPRALGNRSLLADPRDPGMRERLNLIVKHREDFRPFAPSVLAEEADRWFDIPGPSPATDFMLIGYRARQPERIPAVVHVDATSRIQTVRRETNPRYHRLIAEFFGLTGVPVLLNTSFNDSEPIVCTPADALNTFMRTKIDFLAIGDFLVDKQRQV